MVEIGGIQKTSLSDYPGLVSTVVFLKGCNFRCGYCHNPELIDFERGDIFEEDFFSFLDSRKKLIDGVVITGGEPTCQKDLIDFISRIKEKGFKVKLDTNGSNPDMISNVLDLVDYFAMDIKAPYEKYSSVCGVSIDISKIKKSIELIINSGKDYEFRMTVIPALISSKDIIDVSSIIKGGKLFVIQQFNYDKKILDNNLINVDRFSKDELEVIKEKCQKNLKTKVR